MRKTVILFLLILLLLNGCGKTRESEGAEDKEMTEHIQIETVETGSFTMDYFRFGHGSETLVILPGLSVQSVMLSADAVAEAYRLLADDFTVYVFDRRNELPDAYSVNEAALDTAEALRALGLRNVSVLGASQGGMMAMVMAVEQPELVQKLILCSAAAGMDEQRYKTIDSWVRLAKAGNAADLYLAFGEAIYPEELFGQSRELFVEAAKSVTDEELDRFVILAEGMRGFDVTRDLKNISCPVLVIGARDDRLLGADASEQIADALNGQNTVLHMYDGYGHAVYDTAPDFKERVLSFLTAG